MSTNKKKRKISASGDEAPETDKERKNIENIQEMHMSSVAEESPKEEKTGWLDFESFEIMKRGVSNNTSESNDVEEEALNNTLEEKKIKFNWNHLQSIVPEDFKGVALFGIAVMACAISTVLTVQFVTEVRGDAGYITLGLGLMWELSKYTFGSIAILHPLQKMRMVLGWTTAILIFGSIAASLGYLTEMNDFVETNKMVDSVEYQDLQNERDVLKSQMDTLLMSAAEDTKRSYRRRGLETNKKIEDLRDRYTDLGEEMVELREIKVKLNTFDAVASLIISLMLEICGILAISLFAQNKEKSFV